MKSVRSRHAAPVSVYVLLVILCLLQFLFAWHCYPVPGHDASYFVPASLSQLQGSGLRNPLWALLRLRLDTTGEARLTGHGFLYPLYLTLAGKPQLKVLFLLHSLVAIVVLWASFIFCRKAALYQGVEVGRLQYVLSLLAIASFGIHFGRPEPLAALFVLASIPCFLFFSESTKCIFAGMLLAFLWATAPGTATVASVIVCLYFFNANSFIRALLHVAVSSLVAFVTLLVVLFLIYPHPIELWFAGMLRHYQALMRAVINFRSELSLFDLAAIRYNLLVNPGSTAIGLLWYIVLLVFIPVLLRRAKVSGTQLGTLLGVVVVASFFLGVVLIRPESIYWFAPFSPLAIVVLVLRAQQGGLAFRRSTNALLLLLGIPLIRATILFPYFLYGGMSHSEASEKFQQLQAVHGPKIVGSNQIWTLSSRINDLSVLQGKAKIESLGRKGHPIVVLQHYSGRLQPPEFEHFFVAMNDFRPQAVTILGVPLAQTWPGYQFALLLPRPWHEIRDIESVKLK